MELLGQLWSFWLAVIVDICESKSTDDEASDECTIMAWLLAHFSPWLPSGLYYYSLSCTDADIDWEDICEKGVFTFCIVFDSKKECICSCGCANNALEGSSLVVDIEYDEFLCAGILPWTKYYAVINKVVSRITAWLFHSPHSIFREIKVLKKANRPSVWSYHQST